MGDTFDLAIVGGGIVGLATAWRLLERKPSLSVAVLEKESDVALHQSGHNTGVIHAGIYYRPGSLKARLCQEGKAAVERFADEHGIPYRRCGKLIVALDDSELGRLAELEQRARANGVPGLELVGPERLREIEPHVAGIRGLYSPETGVIDFRRVALAYAEDIRARGAAILTRHRVVGMRESGGLQVLRVLVGGGEGRAEELRSGSHRTGHHAGAGPAAPSPSAAAGKDGPALVDRTAGAGAWSGPGGPAANGSRTANGSGPPVAADITARYVISCAGLYSDRIAAMSGSAGNQRIVPFRGDYYTFTPEARPLVRALINPVPDPTFPFLGVHFSRRMDDEVLAGPNAVLAFAREGYTAATISLPDLMETLVFPGFRRLIGKYYRTGARELWKDLVKPAFVRSLQRYLPELRAEQLVFGPSGVRAQSLGSDGSLLDDFSFAESAHVLHVRNAPSPAATASLAIGRYLAEKAEARFGL